MATSLHRSHVVPSAPAVRTASPIWLKPQSLSPLPQKLMDPPFSDLALHAGSATFRKWSAYDFAFNYDGGATGTAGPVRFLGLVLLKLGTYMLDVVGPFWKVKPDRNPRKQC